MCQEKNGSCLKEVLEVILILQENAACDDFCLEACDRAYLGCVTKMKKCNTRPVVLYNCEGTLWEMPVAKEEPSLTDFEGPKETSHVFRIEKIDHNCATFRVLKAVANEEEPYESTDSFFIINLNCVCCLRCLADCFVCGV